MKRSYYLTDPKGREMFFFVLAGLLANAILKLTTGVAAYLFLVRYTSLDVRQLAAVIIAMMIADKVSIRFEMKE